MVREFASILRASVRADSTVRQKVNELCILMLFVTLIVTLDVHYRRLFTGQRLLCPKALDKSVYGFSGWLECDVTTVDGATPRAGMDVG